MKQIASNSPISTATEHKFKNVVVGAGPVGMATALALNGRGEEVVLLERRSADGSGDPAASFNLTLVRSSLEFLCSLGSDMSPLVTEIVGRQIWAPGGPFLHRYGLRSTDRLFAVARPELHARLASEIRRRGIEMFEGAELISLDARRGRARFVNNDRGTMVSVEAERFFVADGANSRGREEIVRQADIGYSRALDGNSYASVLIPTSTGGVLDKARIHFAGGNGAMDIAIPNRDGSFALLFERPDRVGVSSLGTKDAIRQFLADPWTPDDLRLLVPDLEVQMRDAPVRRFKYAGASHRGFARAVLLGDAGQTFPPYLGSGLNSGLYDVAALFSALDTAEDDWDFAVKMFEKETAARSAQLFKLAGVHGRQLVRGSFGGALWRLQDHAARAAEFASGFRSLYQRTVFDVDFPQIRTVGMPSSVAVPVRRAPIASRAAA